MNDLGLEDAISSADHAVRMDLRHDDDKNAHPSDRANKPGAQEGNSRRPRVERSTTSRYRHARRARENQRRVQHKYNHADAEESSIYQPTLWWLTSTAFPLVAGTFGPIANLFSVCALVQTWRVAIEDGKRISDPHWLTVLNACSLFLALAANISLLFNFARRIPYSIAQPVTITLWYLSCIFLAVPIGLTHNSHVDAYLQPINMEYSQSYYYALISAILYSIISSLLLLSTLGSTVFHAYPPSFSTLTVPQRTLMLQTISFSLYLALGAGVYAIIEDWEFVDAVYWADYTLLTVGLGSDFPLQTTLGRMLLIPYAAFGITLVGLVVSSVRGLVLERAKAKVVRRHLGKERDKWKENIIERHRLHQASMHETSTPTDDSHSPLSLSTGYQWMEKLKERRLMRMPRQLSKYSPRMLSKEDQQGKWHRAEFELMRFIEAHTESTERYTALAVSFIVILIVWIGGSLVFWSSEHTSQNWTYPQSIYFTYTTLLTIGYGDFYPRSSAGKPFFVVWSLISVPAMTVLIANMGDTVVKCVQNVTLAVSKWTILPERMTDSLDEKEKTGNKDGKRRMRKGKSRQPSSSAGDVALEHDIEYLGDEVEKFEEDEGRPGSIAARLAREIANLAKDLRKKPPKKYTWAEWERWLEMLGEREEDGRGTDEQQDGAFPVVHPPLQSESVNHDAAAHTPGPESSDASQPQVPNSPACQRINDMPSRKPALKNLQFPTGHEPWGLKPVLAEEPHAKEHKQAVGESGAETDNEIQDKMDWQWTWLGDQGPLFSRLNETEWIIERLSFRLEEVLEDEIREARASVNRKS